MHRDSPTAKGHRQRVVSRDDRPQIQALAPHWWMREDSPSHQYGGGRLREERIGAASRWLLSIRAIDSAPRAGGKDAQGEAHPSPHRRVVPDERTSFLVHIGESSSALPDWYRCTVRSWGGKGKRRAGMNRLNNLQGFAMVPLVAADELAEERLRGGGGVIPASNGMSSEHPSSRQRARIHDAAADELGENHAEGEKEYSKHMQRQLAVECQNSVGCSRLLTPEAKMAEPRRSEGLRSETPGRMWIRPVVNVLGGAEIGVQWGLPA
ncbi:hypothetical protein C8R44DRAFT_754867 [Mycena epipterygia]|nr:hypothetical protein C8R44DRAFT_754867 [Mycena epipterygia]